MLRIITFTVGMFFLLISIAASAEAQSAQAGDATQQGQPPPPTPQQRVAMLKQWLQASQAQIRNYEWVETTIISKDGEQKSHQQKRCYYGVDGKLQKVDQGSQPEQKSGGGPLRKRMAENKKAEISEYMQQVTNLIHQYIPPDPDRIQQSVNAGKFSGSPVVPGQRGRLTFGDYLKPGDALSVDVELPTNRLLGMAVDSYVDSPDDVVQLKVDMGVLPDGTIYTARTTVDATREGITVVVENTGYHHGG